MLRKLTNPKYLLKKTKLIFRIAQNIKDVQILKSASVSLPVLWIYLFFSNFLSLIWIIFPTGNACNLHACGQFTALNQYYTKYEYGEALLFTWYSPPLLNSPKKSTMYCYYQQGVSKWMKSQAMKHLQILNMGILLGLNALIKNLSFWFSTTFRIANIEKHEVFLPKM